MDNVAIRFDRVSKTYRIDSGWDRSIRDEFSHFLKRAIGRGGKPDLFWALRDATFDIARGETVGLVGSNGAGKSTTLKILSRVTVPSAGTFQTRGRVGALIEVGAGFHPDLSGRENVYLNGAIMGMKRREIERKFQQIVAFSEVEKFIDTPLKFYSSGMMVRLGFAVAAHIEPEILLIDEVLAVGDTAFQAKCLNKIAELKREDKTIVLVSHSMSSIIQHTSRVLWIDQGAVKAFGNPEETVERYLKYIHGRGVSTGKASPNAAGPIRIAGVTVQDLGGRSCDVLKHGSAAAIEVAYEIVGKVDDPVVSLTFVDIHGHPLGSITTRFDGTRLDADAASGTVRLVLEPLLFTRGTFGVTVGIYDNKIQHCFDLRPRAVSFMVDGPSVASREIAGHVVYPHRWEVTAAAPVVPVQ